MFSHQPKTAQAFSALVTALSNESALSAKEQHLAYIAVLSAVRLLDGIPFHVKAAQDEGATDEQILSASLVGLPAVGLRTIAGHEAVQQSLVSMNTH